MSFKKALLIVCAVALGLFVFCGIGEWMVDSSSRGRHTALEKTVSSVAARTDAAAADAATALEQVNVATAGAGGKAGANGLACWDIDGNGDCDIEDDVNGDGECDVLDCRGDVGPKGDRGKPGFGVKIRIGGRDGKPGKDGKDCVGGGGECVFTSVCCTDDGDKPSTATATPTSTAPAKDKDKAKKQKKQKRQRRPAPPATIEAGGSVVNYNYNSINVEGVDPGSVDSGEPLNVGRIRNEGTLNLNVNSVRVQ